MKKNTAQEKFWSSAFGRDYSERNNFTNPKALDDFYVKKYGLARSKLNQNFLSGLKIENILEVGCNIGNQLALLQKQGYKNLYGVEIQDYAVERAKELTKNINIIKGSVFDLPFKDGYFDLVFTADVLIHINPKDIKRALREIYRVSKKYIWGQEYFSEKYQPIVYRGNKNCLWKTDFAKLYKNTFPKLKLLKKAKLPYLENSNLDEMFLFKKI